MMKKFGILLLGLSFFITSCSSDDDFEDTDTIGNNFLIENVEFNESNNFAIGFPLPTDFELIAGDVVLVYRLENVVNGDEVWEPLPTAMFNFDENNDGIIDNSLQYRFNYTFRDVDILIESLDPSALSAEFTRNQVFQIVTVPANIISQDLDIDFSDIKDVYNKLHLNINGFE
ncbi:hypothetical protein NBT05_12720 [Aquimarina sp. ERC-38]|uniref:hypothetical protein n=1 Tax=Aquimarina sp. ERC-38 TaxID=2949996 RepID=UPI00224627DE|nr:hypothetical protein [Aquimarina sp. ERC-38]UZO79812.1 hypothetical protein NBT05_12720 [Aquimarina sp. ERC-38]